jgi:hypothetical protein
MTFIAFRARTIACAAASLAAVALSPSRTMAQPARAETAPPASPASAPPAVAPPPSAASPAASLSPSASGEGAFAARIAGTTPLSQQNRMAFAFTWNPEDGHHDAFLVADGNWHVSPHLMMGVRGGLGFSTVDGPTREDLRWSNAELSLHYAFTPLPGRLAAYVGGSVYAPALGMLSPNNTASYPLARYIALEGVYRPGLFVPGMLPLAARGGVEVGVPVRPNLAFLYRGELGFTLLANVFRHQGTGDVDLFVEHASDVELRESGGFGGGLRGQLVLQPFWLGKLGGADGTQAALEPYVQWMPELDAPERGLFVRLGLLLALDEPLGPATNDDAIHSVRLHVGGRWGSSAPRPRRAP